MGRMVAALASDIIGFSEVDDVSAAYEGSTRVLVAGTTWNVVKDDYDLMVATTWPIESSYLHRLPQLPRRSSVRWTR